jgi:raffinose/stachyose/melibiose transport system permease protein
MTNFGRLHWWMPFPAVVLFTLFFVAPLFQGFGLALTDWNGFSPAHFIGLDNFVRFWADERARTDVVNTVLFALGSAPLLILLGLSLALLVDGERPAQRVARVVLYLPAVISPLVMGYIWYFLLQPGRGFFHLGDWYTSGWAVAVLIAVNVWQYAGMTMVVFSAGLQSIPGDLYESAALDGADAWQKFRSITLPLLQPVMAVNVVTNIIGSLAVFDIVVSLTDGGPGYASESLSLFILRMVYGNSTGYSSAVALVLFLITLVPVALYLRLLAPKDTA